MQNKYFSLLSCWAIIALFALPSAGNAQIYTDYLGAGHHQGINVSSSGMEEGFSAAATLNGNGIDSAYMKVQSSRFLAQATLGSGRNEIEAMANMGFEAWLDEQADRPVTNLEPLLEDILIQLQQRCEDLEGAEETCEFLGLGATFSAQFPWWQALMTGQDQLRQRVALALSEILVVSGIGFEEEPYGLPLVNYYDVLMNNALGNYEELLMEVTLHPMMGAYLSHFNNPKTQPELNIRPDENYAREVMQLFTIGLFELNM
ncbi:MAG: DUF1800 family protein, partial [Bacteroidota bacterium]